MYVVCYILCKKEGSENIHKHLSNCVSIYLSIYLSMYLSMYLCIYVSIYLSICVSIYLSNYGGEKVEIWRETSLTTAFYTFFYLSDMSMLCIFHNKTKLKSVKNQALK